MTFATTLSFVLAGMPAGAFAQARVIPASLGQPVPSEAALSSAFNAYPNGGPELSARIADLIVAAPALAADLANYLKADRGLTEAQKQAAREGLARALVRLNVYGQDVPPPPGLTPEMIALLAGLAGAGILIGVLSSHHASTPASPN